ncbi:F-box protein SKIP23-like isoform X1 [Typha latifolia]|uniref:F-box protein SKIP23-like isoform X1 n=1 Tax=Typha latifolia TaxID=4733 RepID=UPI003C2F072B
MDSSGCTDLSSDVLSLISTFLTNNSAYIRFRSVCAQWRRAAAPEPRHLPPQLPLLLLDGVRVLGPSTKTWEHNTQLLRETEGRRCYASSHGWLVLDGEDRDVVLFNPITRNKISLPPLTSLPFVLNHIVSGVDQRYVIHGGSTLTGTQMRDYAIKKIVLSSNPNPSSADNCVAMAIMKSTCSTIGFCRGGDTTWITTDIRAYVWDICHSDGLFYSLDNSPRITVWDDKSPTSIATFALGRILGSLNAVLERYLVGTSDGLLMVIRCVCYNYYGVRTTCFKVYKVDFDSTGAGIPRQMKMLGNRALFVGGHNSLSMPSTQGFPRENGIYFVDYYNGKHYMKVYNLADGNVEILAEVDRYKHASPPTAIWFTPSLS